MLAIKVLLSAVKMSSIKDGLAISEAMLTTDARLTAHPAPNVARSRKACGFEAGRDEFVFRTDEFERVQPGLPNLC